MRYLSEDNKVFNSEQECCEHEQKIRSDKVMKEKLEEERKKRLKIINEKYQELQKLVSDFERDFVVSQKPYFASIYELMDMLCI